MGGYLHLGVEANNIALSMAGQSMPLLWTTVLLLLPLLGGPFFSSAASQCTCPERSQLKVL
jgi:hypothetical protein